MGAARRVENEAQCANGAGDKSSISRLRKHSERTCRLLNRILIVLITTALWTGAACTNVRRSRSNFPTHLPSGVKIRDYPKVTDVEHVAIRINPDSIRFTRVKTLKGVV